MMVQRAQRTNGSRQADRVELLTFEYQHIRLVAADEVHGHRQSLQITREREFFSIRQLPVVFVGDHQGAIAYSPERGRSTFARLRCLVRSSAGADELQVSRLSRQRINEREAVA